MSAPFTRPAILAAIMAAAAATSTPAGQPSAVIDSNTIQQLPSDEAIGASITAAERERIANLPDYTVTRRYKLHNTRLSKDAVMTVALTYRKGQGKSFEIVDVEPVSGLSRRVLQKLIDSEAESSREQSRDPLEISSKSYRFHVTGIETMNGRRCYVVELTPKRKSKFLLEGKAWADMNDFGLVRVEGRPSASLSFWVGKPHVVQDFEKVGQFWMASHNRSESQSMMLGSSVLTIEYSGYELGNSDFKVAENHAASPRRRVHN